MLFEDKNYAEEWFDYGKEHNDDSVTKFIMHWIAFNWMYRDYGGSREPDKIEKFCECRYDDLSRYYPFDKSEIAIFKEGPVYRGPITRRRRVEGGAPPKYPSHRSPQQLYEGICNEEGLLQTQCLLLTIYRVRCNLFHGSKSPHDDRDLKLVQASAAIMEKYLKVLLQ